MHERRGCEREPHALLTGYVSRAPPAIQDSVDRERTALATSKLDGIVRFKCDVHGWMSGFVGVSHNPYFAVSSDDGSFRIENVPSGKYSLAAWHEKFGEKVVEVSVEPGRNEQVVFHYGQKLTEARPH